MLAKKEALLEGQQQKLAAWAEELRRRELLLAQQKARLEGRTVGGAGLAGSSAAAGGGLAVGGGRGGSAHSVSFSPVERRPLQPPIPCESPVIAGRPGPAGAAASPVPRCAVDESAAVTPTSNGGVAPAVAELDGGGGTPGTPALPGEWQEEYEPVRAIQGGFCPCVRRQVGAQEIQARVCQPRWLGWPPAFHPRNVPGCIAKASASPLPGQPTPRPAPPAPPQGVHLTFASEGGVTKLKRIRFSRSLFSAESAKQVRSCLLFRKGTAVA